jgi:3D (Asp-Asp-Asp) domain-containing protein
MITKLITTTILIIGLVVIAFGQTVTHKTATKLINKTVINKAVGSTYTATAYCLKGKMANGQTVHSGAIAADRKVLPLGSKVKIGNSHYVVKDTGGAIKGKRIDIWLSTCSAAKQYGRRQVNLLLE